MSKLKERQERAMKRRIRNKSGIAFLIAAVLSAVLIIRLIVIYAGDGTAYSQDVLDRQTKTYSRTVAGRGKIMDRNGAILAYSEHVYNLILDPKKILDNPEVFYDVTVDSLCDAFDMSRQDLEKQINDNPERQYVKIANEITKEQREEFTEIYKEYEFQRLVQEAKKRDRIYPKEGVSEEEAKEAISVECVWFEDSYSRRYPFDTFAADVIGFASGQGDGVIGLERQYDDELKGTDGLSYSYIDNDLEAVREVKDRADGLNVVTTIDFTVQSILEEKIREYNKEKPSVNTAAIVYDPNNGEVLGMASYPFFDLNNPRDLSDLFEEKELEAMTDDSKTEALSKLWNNFCVSQMYEPGSTFKSFTVAAALEEGKTFDGEEFYCAGSKEVEGINIRCWRSDYGGHGTLDLREALADSCNVAMMEIGNELGAERLVENHYAFGFGSKTGIDLPGEERGLLKDPESMTETDIATNSFGQSLNVNMVQMVAAYASLINGGYYYQPHITKAITDNDGQAKRTINPKVVRQTVTADTSDHIKEYLKAGMEEYAVQYSKVPGYSMGGKTATAQKIPRSEKKWLVSVMSFAPVENPKFILYVLIDEPDGTTGGSGDGMDSQYLTKEIMTALLPQMGVAPEDPQEAESYRKEYASENEDDSVIYEEDEDSDISDEDYDGEDESDIEDDDSDYDAYDEDEADEYSESYEEEYSDEEDEYEEYEEEYDSQSDDDEDYDYYDGEAEGGVEVPDDDLTVYEEEYKDEDLDEEE